jgi:hypothetical protein
MHVRWIGFRHSYTSYMTAGNLPVVLVGFLYAERSLNLETMEPLSFVSWTVVRDVTDLDLSKAPELPATSRERQQIIVMLHISSV